jgi:hypothetical protein
MLDESHQEEEKARAGAQDDATREMIALAPGEGSAIWFLQNRMVLKATGESTGGAFGLVESLIAPGAAPPMHVHHAEDEAF